MQIGSIRVQISNNAMPAVLVELTKTTAGTIRLGIISRFQKQTCLNIDLKRNVFVSPEYQSSDENKL